MTSAETMFEQACLEASVIHLLRRGKVEEAINTVRETAASDIPFAVEFVRRIIEREFK